MVTLNFAVEGLPSVSTDCGAQDEIVRELQQSHLGAARFDCDMGVFSVEIDPATHSFADVRRVIGALGKRRGLVYLAVVMSP